MFIGRYNREEDKKIDVYAYGISLYEILFGIDVWNGLSVAEVKNSVIKGERPEIKDEFRAIYRSHEPILELITQCWDQIPSKRPDFEKVVQIFNMAESGSGSFSGNISTAIH